MISSIEINEIGYCAYRHYKNYVIGRYFLRTMRNGKHDISFKGFLVGENGFNPYCYIQSVSMEIFEKGKLKIKKEFYEVLYGRLETLYTILRALTNSLIDNTYSEGNKSYIFKDHSNSITIGINRSDLYESYETIFVQKRADGITIKIKKNDLFGSPIYHTDGQLSSISSNLYEGIKNVIKIQASDIFNQIEENSSDKMYY